MTDEKKYFPFTDRESRLHLDPKGPGWAHGPVDAHLRRMLANNQPGDPGDLVFETKIESFVPSPLRNANEMAYTALVSVDIMRRLIESENAYERLRNDPRELRTRLFKLLRSCCGGQMVPMLNTEHRYRCGECGKEREIQNG